MSSPTTRSARQSGKVRVSGDAVHAGGESIPTASIRHATVVRRSSPNRLWPYLLLAFSPFAGLAVFLATGWIVVAAISGLSLVILAGILFRDDGEHDVHAHLHDGETKLLYTTRRKRKAQQLVAALGRSTALTDLAVERAVVGRES